MLYDIAPPLLLFGSLGGIILVVSRVVVRIKRHQLSQAIQTEGAHPTRSTQQLLNPTEGRIKLMQSRVAAAGASVKQSVTSLKDIPARLSERRAEKKERSAKVIQAPRSSWRERFSSAYQSTSHRLRRLVSRRRLKRSAVAEINIPTPTPAKVQLRRIEADMPATPAATPRVETTAQRLQALVRRQRATTSPVVEAEQAIQAGNLPAAEDTLVGYLVKHPKNTVAYILLADIAAKREAWSEAVEILEQVIRLDAAAPGAYAKLGEAAIHAGRFTRALEALQRAHDMEPENIAVLKHLLKIAQRMDNRVLQKSVMQKLLAAAPGDPEVHLAADAAEERERNHTQPAQT